MRKTACPVVWKAPGAQSPWAHPIKGQPWWAGFQYWKWEEQQNRPHYHKANGDTGFTIHGKPAEAVLTKWCRQKLS